MKFTKEQIHDAIVTRHKEVFGYIGKDDEGEEVHRDGYFIAGFVKDALDNFKQSSEPVSLKRIVTGMTDEEALDFVQEIGKWCYLDGADNPAISLNGIKKAIELLEEKCQ